ncbi:hypothetical protein CONPUDRAFT_169490 [Coniophora puteana RWD-64-598 SS2]|uniref:BTB domain-containing protein n=1 Tax=Coniophora puteana (strain RWD-64-598) TaxID=741705 RepID=A0A5M3M8D8_CONPW|nr:uncharacterized protein CONPUDRAFT_169490 [Coniophora puteana RWD-64-598 SS2]EIW75055.1 hypothetical protein CONPUDRAFT_169490 [Coniophora puteana RWD-64-598 SS2]
MMSQAALTASRPASPDAYSLRAPFDDCSADFVIQTTDGVRFGVHKFVLSLASLLLRRTFSASPLSFTECDPSIVVKQAEDEGRDTVLISEESRIVEIVLRFIYPYASPCVEKVEDIQSALAMMDKLGMKDMMNRLRPALVQPSILEAEPLRIFCIAHRYGFQDEAKRAAYETLRHPIFLPFVPELAHISASAYHQLLAYHRNAGLAAAALTSDFSWFPTIAPRWVWFQCDDCAHHSLSWPLSDGKLYEVNAWFIDFMERAREALRERPCAQVLEDPVLLSEALANAAACDMCRSAVFLDLNVFIKEYFVPEVERATKAVEIDLKL